MRVCAGGVLVRGRDLLLARRADDRAFYPGVWDVVGGHCEPGESPRDVLVREVEEEIGVVPRAFRELMVLAEPDPATHGARALAWSPAAAPDLDETLALIRHAGDAADSWRRACDGGGGIS